MLIGRINGAEWWDWAIWFSLYKLVSPSTNSEVICVISPSNSLVIFYFSINLCNLSLVNSKYKIITM